MRPAWTLSTLLSLWTLAACASSHRAVEEEPADPTDEVTEEAAAAATEEAGAGATEEAGAGAAEEAGAGGEGGLTFQGLAIETDEAPETAEAPVTADGAACPDGRALLSVKLLVLLRHPTDPVPALPADGFALTVDGEPAATGVRVGQVHALCVAPGEHEVVARGGQVIRAVRATAPGTANLAVAGGGGGPVPGVPPDRTSPVPAGKR